MQAHTPTSSQPAKAEELSPRVRELVQEKRAQTEAHARGAIERRAEAERELARYKRLRAEAPHDEEIARKRRQATELHGHAVNDCEDALAARELTIARLDEALPDLVELSKREAQLERWQDQSWQAWADHAGKRVATAVGELCAVLVETTRRSEEMGNARSAAMAVALTAGLDGYEAPIVDHEKRLGELRRAAHAAVRKAGLDWRAVRDLFVGY